MIKVRVVEVFIFVMFSDKITINNRMCVLMAQYSVFLCFSMLLKNVRGVYE